MTQQKHLKQLVRTRMTKTGERYAAAHRQVTAQGLPFHRQQHSLCHGHGGSSPRPSRPRTRSVTCSGARVCTDPTAIRQAKR